MRSKTLKRAAAFATAFIMSLGTISVLPEESFPQFSFTAFAEGTVVESGQCGDNVFYELDSEGVLTISGTGYINWRTPNRYKEYIKELIIEEGITQIGFFAFCECTNLKKVTLPESLINILAQSFAGCKSLTDIDIPSKVESIDSFEACESLTNIYVDTNNAYYKSIDGVLFSKDNSRLYRYPAGKTNDTYIVPETVSVISEGAFEGASKLSNIILSKNITRIYSYAFKNCSELTSIVLPDSITEIDTGTFHSCTGLTSIIIPNSVTSIYAGAFYGCSGLTSITIPDSVTSIWSDAFHDCDNLTSITIPDSVTSIGYEAFSSCDSLTSITIPDSVTSIETSAFNNSDNVTIYGYTGSYAETYANNNDIPFVAIEEATIVESGQIGDNVYYELDSKGTLTISGTGEMWTYDGYYTSTSPFYNSDLKDIIKTVVIENGVTTIGDGVFAYCQAMESITIPDSVTSIGVGAFSGCIGLTEVKLTENVTSIGHHAFQLCENLAKITIPASETVIDENVFENCPNITIYGYTDSYAETYANENDIPFVALDGENPEDPDDNNDSNITDFTLQAIDESKTTYRIISYNGNDKNVIIPASCDKGAIVEIYKMAFTGSSVKSVTLSENIATVDEKAFCIAEGLENIYVDKNNTSFKSIDGVLYNYDVTELISYPVGKKETELTIPNGVRTINNYSVYDYTKLLKVIIPDSVDTIEENAFKPYRWLTFIGGNGSEAQRYAIEKGIKFIDSAYVRENGFDPAKHGWNLVNTYDTYGYKKGDKMDSSLWNEVYGYNYTASAWLHKVMSSDWGGDCTGYSLTAVLQYLNKVNLKAYFPDKSGQYLNEFGYTDIGQNEKGFYTNIALNKAAIDMIQKSQISQFSNEFKATRMTQFDNDKSYKNLIEYLNGSNPAPILVRLFFGSGGGHSVVISTDVKPSEYMENGVKYVLVPVYDCGAPAYTAVLDYETSHYSWYTNPYNNFLRLNTNSGKWELFRNGNAYKENVYEHIFDQMIIFYDLRTLSSDFYTNNLSLPAYDSNIFLNAKELTVADMNGNVVIEIENGVIVSKQSDCTFYQDASEIPDEEQSNFISGMLSVNQNQLNITGDNAKITILAGDNVSTITVNKGIEYILDMDNLSIDAEAVEIGNADFALLTHAKNDGEISAFIEISTSMDDGEKITLDIDNNNAKITGNMDVVDSIVVGNNSTNSDFKNININSGCAVFMEEQLISENTSASKPGGVTVTPVIPPSSKVEPTEDDDEFYEDVSSAAGVEAASEILSDGDFSSTVIAISFAGLAIVVALLKKKNTE